VRHARALLILAAATLALADAPAFAQPLTSAGPDRVSVTIYRNPERSPRDEIDPDWLQGFALITEQRTVTIPAGRAVIRFEGVAAGILPESAIVTGLPEGVREKNLDADLLSPYSLYARSYGRPVTIRRTGPDKKIIEERGVIRSGPDGAAILQTKDGFEAARCDGSDSLVYDSVPEGLSPRPTLSVETEAARGGQVTITLSYLAWGFDWQANYVATMRPDGRTADLFAWVTLASGDVTSFADAETMVVAGRLNREGRDDDDDGEEPEQELDFHCLVTPIQPVPPPPPPPAPPPMEMAYVDSITSEDIGEAIVVSGSRMVRQEELGDLKLYRVPHQTTVAAKSQKQVALLDKQSVPVDVIYALRVDGDDAGDISILLRAQNRKEKGLGLPLPAGPVAVFEPLGERRLLVGEGGIGDKAVNEEVEIEIAEATQVTAEIEEVDYGDDWEDHELTVSNANPWPVRVEAAIVVGEDHKRTRSSARLGRKDGRDLWAVTVPANGTARLRYRLKEIERKDSDD
jgi:hypothetical protein